MLSSLLSFVLDQGIVLADDYYVHAELGTDNPSCGGSPGSGACKTITYTLSQLNGSEGNPATINVASGTYNPSLGEVFPLNMEDYVSLQGEGQSITIIDADGTDSVITSNSANEYFIDGVTIQNGSSTNGGGMYCNSSSPTITNCTFSGNVATGGTQGVGGGIHISNSSPTITNCTFSGNTAYHGGGIAIESSSPTIANCIFSGNVVTGQIGAGGGINTFSSSSTITNCTFSGNTAERCGGGISAGFDDGTTITNSIIWGNSANESGPDMDCPFGTEDCPTVSYCNIGEYDPLFISGPLGEYYLSQISAGQGADSPCVDAGSDTAENLDMNHKTTRIDSIIDSGMVDVGYHYPNTACGNDILEFPEQCDDGNYANGDGCSDICESETCLEEFGDVQIIDNGDGTYDYYFIRDGITLIEINNNEDLIDLTDFSFTSLGNNAMSISNLPLNGTTKSVVLSYKTKLCAVDDDVFVASLGNWDCSSDPDRILWTQSEGNPCGEPGNPVAAEDESGEPLPQYTCEKFIQGNKTYAKMSGFTHTTVMGEDAASIPTLSEWGLIIFMTIILGIGVMILRKRRMV